VCSSDLDRACVVVPRLVAGAQMLDVFNKFIEAEFKTDWDKAVAAVRFAHFPSFG